MNGKKSYPEELERHWLAEAASETHATGGDRDALARLAGDVRRLADRFTTERPSGEVADYFKNTRTCLAYALYFGPLSDARMRLIGDEAPVAEARRGAGRPWRILDAGAGIGASSWAALQRAEAAGHESTELDAWDRSRVALRCLHGCFTACRERLWPRATLRTHAGDVREAVWEEGRYDEVILHYVLNEMDPAARASALAKAARALAEGGTLWICEPLVRAEGDWMGEIRRVAVEELGLRIWAPCPHEGPCQLGEPCHAVRTFAMSRSLQILNTGLKRDVRHLAFAWLALRKGGERDGRCRVRLTAPPSFAKGQVLYRACCPDGSVSTVQVLERGLDGKGRKALRGLERGEALELERLSLLGDGKTMRGEGVVAAAAGGGGGDVPGEE